MMRCTLNNYRFLTFLGLIGLMLIACNLSNLIATEVNDDPSQNVPVIPTQIETPSVALESTSTPLNPLSSASACLNGTWTINNLSSYVIAAIPPDMLEEYKLEYKDTSGNATLTLSPDGRISLNFEGLIFRFDANVSIFTVPLTVGIDGEASGGYSLEGDTLTTTQMDTSELTAVAQAMGQDVVDSAQIISLIPLVQPPFNTAIYTCIGDTLQLQFPAYPADFPPLVFKRLP
jgi:hypothetical protein